MVTEVVYFVEDKEKFLTSFDYYIYWCPFYYTTIEQKNRDEWLNFDLDLSLGNYSFSKMSFKNIKKEDSSKIKATDVIIPCVRACVMTNIFSLLDNRVVKEPPLKWNKDIKFEMNKNNIPVSNVRNMHLAFESILNQLNNDSQLHNKRIVADYPDFLNFNKTNHYKTPTVKFYRDYVKERFEPLLYNLNLFLAKEIY